MSSSDRPCWPWPGAFSTPPVPPRKNIHVLPKNVSPSDFPSPVSWPRCRFPGQSPSGIQVQWTPAQGFTPKTRKRPRADTVKSTYLKPSWHHRGTTTVPRPKPECDPLYQRIPLLSHQEPHPSKQTGPTLPHQAQSGRGSERWTRVILSLVPVRGVTPPSISLPFHWRAETWSQTFFPRSMDFFLFIFGFNEINFFNEDWYWSSVTSDIWDHGYIPASCHCSSQKWTQVLHICVVSLTREKEREKRGKTERKQRFFSFFIKKRTPTKKMPWDQVPGLLSQGCGALVSWYQGSHLYLPLPYVFTCNTILSTSPLYYTFLYRQLVPYPPQDTRRYLHSGHAIWFCKKLSGYGFARTVCTVCIIKSVGDRKIYVRVTVSLNSVIV